MRQKIINHCEFHLVMNVFGPLAIAALLLLSMAACQKAPETPVGQSVKITIAYPASLLSVLPYLAFKKGYFEEEGLEVTPQLHKVGKMALQAMLERKADIAISADTPVMFAITAGQKIYILTEVASSSRATAIVARKDRGVSSPADLRGKRVGVSLGTTGDFFLDSFLSVRGIGRNDLKVVDMKPDEMLDALLKDKVDAVSAWQPFLKRVELGLKDNGTSFYDESLYNDIGCVSARQAFVGKHPEAIGKVLKALIKAGKFARMNPGEAQRLIADLTRADASFVGDIWGSYDFRVTLDQSLLVSLEDQTRWRRKNKFAGFIGMPNYLDYIYFDGLQTVKPEAVRITR